MKQFINKRLFLELIIIMFIIFFTGINNYYVKASEDDNIINENEAGDTNTVIENETDDTNVIEEEPSTEVTTDFSNAKFELKKDGNSGAILEISNFTKIDGHFYNFFVTSNSAKPEVPENSSMDYMEYDSTDKKLKSKLISKYVELNQDLYVSIIEYADDMDSTVVSWGNKLTRFSEPKYNDAFFATFVVNGSTQIVTNFTHSSNNENRKLQIKIGKVTDTSILQNIKNQNINGFEELLSYAKANSGMYDQTVDSTSKSAIEYCPSGNGIELNGLENEGYYYLYIKADTENDKYIPCEAVTLAKSSVYSGGSWYLFFYGSDKFSWSDFSGEGTGEASGDNTKADKILPYTGKKLFLVSGLIVLFGISGTVFYRKNDYFKGIK